MGYISSNIYCLLNWKIIINFWLWKNFSFGQIHFGFLFSVSAWSCSSDYVDQKKQEKHTFALQLTLTQYKTIEESFSHFSLYFPHSSLGHDSQAASCQECRLILRRCTWVEESLDVQLMGHQWMAWRRCQGNTTGCWAFKGPSTMLSESCAVADENCGIGRNVLHGCTYATLEYIKPGVNYETWTVNAAI